MTTPGPQTQTHLVSVSNRATIGVWSFGHRAIRECIRADTYRVIVPAVDLEAFREVTGSGFVVESEELYLRDISPMLDSHFNGQASRYGWFLQQFIKLSATQRLCERGNVVIWDADTIPLRSIDFFPSGFPSFFTGVEHHPPYFAVIQRLLGLEKQTSFSFIAQCLPISSRHGQSFFRTLESKRGRSWFEEVITSIDFREPAGFSEYETVGSYVFARFPEDLRWQDGRWLRNGWQIFSSPKAAALGYWRRFWRREYAFCSFERYQEPTNGMIRLKFAILSGLHLGKRILGKWAGVVRARLTGSLARN